MKSMNQSLLLLLSLASFHLHAHVPSKEETIANRKRIESLATPKCSAVPEGGFVYFYHPMVGEWVQEAFQLQKIREIRAKLAPYLKIPLTKEGFTSASTRRDESEMDATGYSAIWVRDCCWHYYGLKISDREAAKTLMLNLANFYAEKGQIQRLLNVIENPQVADPKQNTNAHMDVPLIRFSSKTLSHHQVDGKDQEWNHLQLDSHGLFLLALSDALSTKIVSPVDFKPQYFEALALFPAFFTEIDYAQKGDAGPWEEELLHNASSAGLVASGQKRIMEVINATPALRQGLNDAVVRLKKQYNNRAVLKKIESSLSAENIKRLYQAGLKRVEKNLNLGGEAPNLDGKGIDRRADIALLFLCLPEHALYTNNTQKIREILNLTLSLVGPYGVYRYKYDAYQAANYWIASQVPSAISGPETPQRTFVTRFEKGYTPSKQPLDAQWFFDSNFAKVYYNLSMLEKDPQVQAYYVRKGDMHLKRSLGQLTGLDSYAANGEKLPPLQLPESINTVIDIRQGVSPMPSPICPLGWATAALLMALESAETAHGALQK